MEKFSKELKAYFSSGDALSRGQLLQTHPALQEKLNSPELVTELLQWLSTNEPWDEANVNLTINVLGFLRVHATDSDASIVKVFLLHTNALVRLRVYEYLLTLFFPDKNREALFLVLQGMLSDQDEQVRSEAANYIERANAVEYLKGFLERWLKSAESQGWRTTESFELIERLLKK